MSHGRVGYVLLDVVGATSRAIGSAGPADGFEPFSGGVVAREHLSNRDETDSLAVALPWCFFRHFQPPISLLYCRGWAASREIVTLVYNSPSEGVCILGFRPDLHRVQPLPIVASPSRNAFGGHPASIVPAAYSSVPKTGENRRTSRPHLALRGTRAPPTCTRTCAFEGPLGSPRRAIQPSSREKTAHDLRVGELQWPPEDGENVTNRTVNAPLKTGQNAEIGNAAVRAASGERAARARLPITVIDRQSLGEALAWWRKSYAT